MTDEVGTMIVLGQLGLACLLVTLLIAGSLAYDTIAQRRHMRHAQATNLAATDLMRQLDAILERQTAKLERMDRLSRTEALMRLLHENEAQAQTLNDWWALARQRIVEQQHELDSVRAELESGQRSPVAAWLEIVGPQRVGRVAEVFGPRAGELVMEAAERGQIEPIHQIGSENIVAWTTPGGERRLPPAPRRPALLEGLR